MKAMRKKKLLSFFLASEYLNPVAVGLAALQQEIDAAADGGTVGKLRLEQCQNGPRRVHHLRRRVMHIPGERTHQAAG